MFFTDHMAFPEWMDEIADTTFKLTLCEAEPIRQLDRLDEILLERDSLTSEVSSQEFPEKVLVDLHPRKRLREERNLEEEIHRKRYDAGLTKFPTLKEELQFRAISNPGTEFPKPFESRETLNGEQALFLNADLRSTDPDYIRHQFQLVSYLIHDYHRKHPKSVSKTLIQLFKLALALTERHQQLAFHEKPLALGELWKPLSLVIQKTWRKLL